MYCCPHSTIYCRYANGIQFEKLKTKYNIEEDLVVNYELQDIYAVCTSSRDWIGIYPRGWTNLQQYLTFEYVVLSPKALTELNRSITFPRNFNREALPNVDYQFVYVSKEIEILGTSSYFRFTMPPTMRPHDRNSSTPRSRGIPVHEGHPLIASISTCKKRLGSSKSVDDVLRSCPSGYSFEDQRQRMCRFCMKSTSFTTNRIQFLLLHNQQLVARINRLDRDLELTEASVKNERIARATLTKKLRTYETFVADLFRNLNIGGIVKIVDKSKKEVVVKRIKSRELMSMRDEKGDKSLPLVDLSMSSRSEKHECKEKEEINYVANRMEEVILEPNLVGESENEETTLKTLEKDVSHPMKKELVANREEKGFEITVSIDEQQRRYSTENPIITTELAENQCCPYVTKEVTASRREDNGCRATCKNEQPIGVEGKLEHAKNIVGDDKKTTDNGDSSLVGFLKCCCDYHLNASKSQGADKRFDNDNVKEWALECECDLEIHDRAYQIIDNLTMEPDCSTVETTDDGLSAILIKGRNSKFTVIRKTRSPPLRYSKLNLNNESLLKICIAGIDAQD